MGAPSHKVSPYGNAGVVCTRAKKSKQGARRGRMMEERRNSCVAAGFPLHGAFFKTRHAGDAHSCWSGSCRRERASERDLHGGCLMVYSMDAMASTPGLNSTTHPIRPNLNDNRDRREKESLRVHLVDGHRAYMCVKKRKKRICCEF